MFIDNQGRTATGPVRGLAGRAPVSPKMWREPQVDRSGFAHSDPTFVRGIQGAINKSINNSQRLLRHPDRRQAGRWRATSSGIVLAAFVITTRIVTMAVLTFES